MEPALKLMIAKFLEAPTSGFIELFQTQLMFSTRIVPPLAKATVEQCDNFVRRQHTTFSLEADVLSSAAQQVAARLDVVGESRDRPDS
jgi:hypothetical protein